MKKEKKVSETSSKKKTIKKAVSPKPKGIVKDAAYFKKIAAKVWDICEADDNLCVREFNANFALIIKKKNVNVVKVINENSMQPYKSKMAVTFFDTFVVQWTGDKLSGKLVEMGMPVHEADTLEGVAYVIREA